MRNFATEPYKETEVQVEHVLRTNTGEWFQYYAGDEENNYWIMKDIEDEELINFPLHQYTLLETKPRQIPEKEPDIQID
ncbi:hypothetical protein AAIE21_22205 [Paenibacillus sp. 102]|uniref:hypothetical protein n=1 Tax=Paenibacillus sp. 102 TaxID=3120823 RepID=UPI0031BA4205